jgi:predicted nucleotide-binding protein (sugar kinase/HSP70/actin superfamily)
MSIDVATHPTLSAASANLAEIEAQLAAFEAAERRRLGLEEHSTPNWHDPNPQRFLASQRADTTLLVGGLTIAQDLFVRRALKGVGYNVVNLDCPDGDALRFGKEFGNRGQCNPTYFTVGNLVKYLVQLRDREGLSAAQIVERYVFLTAGACGPCRFGTYLTEYRKALRDAGFAGFRVLSFQQQDGLDQSSAEEQGLEMSPPFFLALVKALVAGDVLNAMGYRLRPYEVEPGATDRALDEAKRIIGDALESKTNILLALLKVRRVLARVKVDRTRVKPKVAIIGEFWAMTTEGDGNYHLQRFLESEGAEVDIQLVSAWLLYNVWEVEYDTRDRRELRRHDGGRASLATVAVEKRLIMLKGAQIGIRVLFQTFANLIGLHGYTLPDMDELAEVSHQYFDNHVRGGEGHMEVGKLIMNVLHHKVNMTLSVKPFGCMPSSGVSDGVQSKITELYPEAIFLPIETSGDGAVNVQSRVQMMLFKAKRAAQREVDSALEKHGLTREGVQRALDRVPLLGHPLFRAPHVHGATSADVVEMAAFVERPLSAARAWLERRAAGAPRPVGVAARPGKPNTARLPVVS